MIVGGLSRFCRRYTGNGDTQGAGIGRPAYRTRSRLNRLDLYWVEKASLPVVHSTSSVFSISVPPRLHVLQGQQNRRSLSALRVTSSPEATAAGWINRQRSL